MSFQDIDHVVVDEPVIIGQEAKFEDVAFAAVVFCNVAETYSDDANIECQYTVTSDLVPTSRDWVGLYKVGWMSPRDYIYYEWAPIPPDYQVGCDCDSSILFKACNIPKDDGEFYQFCYISSCNQVRGASTPFQFRKPGADDFVEVEDDEVNMLVIHSKTLHLQEVIQKADDKMKLLEEKAVLDARVANTTDLVMSAQFDVRKLQQEKDELSGKNSVLLEQMETCQQHFTTSQYTQVSEKLQLKLTQQESLVDDLKKTIEHLNLLLETTKSDINKQKVINTQDKEYAQDLEERLKNAEDKLSVAEESRGILQTEVSVFEEVIAELQKKVERYVMECDSVKQKLHSLADCFTQKSEIQKSEMEQIQNDLKSAIMEKDILHNENINRMQQIFVTVDGSCLSETSISSMQQPFQQIKDEVEKNEKECENLELALHNKESEFKMRENDLEKEIAELRDKISMCYEEYRKIYIEKSKLWRKLDKAAHKNASCEQDVSSTLMIEQQMNDLEKELDKKLMMQKNLYLQEADWIKELVESHEKEMKAKMDEIKRLRKKVELHNNLELKVKTLEKCVAEKELEIKRLNEKLRMRNLERTEEETGANVSPSQMTQGFVRYPQSSYGPLYMPNVQPGIMHGMNWPQYPNGPTYHYPTAGQYPFPHGMKTQDGMRPHEGMFPPVQPPRIPHNNYPFMPGQYAPPCPIYGMPHNHLENLDQDCAVEGNDTCSVLNRPEIQSEKVDQPLTPLPFPLESEKSPSSRIIDPLLGKLTSTAPDTHIDSNMQLKNTMSEAQQFEPPRDIGMPGSPSRMDIQKDRFYDAHDDFCIKTCHVCSEAFPAEIDKELFMEHISSHFENFGTFCPICKYMKPDRMSDNDFECHVNKHCEDQESQKVDN